MDCINVLKKCAFGCNPNTEKMMATAVRGSNVINACGRAIFPVRTSYGCYDYAPAKYGDVGRYSTVCDGLSTGCPAPTCTGKPPGDARRHRWCPCVEGPTTATTSTATTATVTTSTSTGTT